MHSVYILFCACLFFALCFVTSISVNNSVIYRKEFHNMQASEISTIFIVVFNKTETIQLPSLKFFYNNSVYEKFEIVRNRVKLFEVYNYQTKNHTNLTSKHNQTFLFLMLTPFYNYTSKICKAGNEQKLRVDGLYMSISTSVPNDILCLKNSNLPYNTVFSIRSLLAGYGVFFSLRVQRPFQDSFWLPCWNPFYNDTPIYIFWTFKIFNKISSASDFFNYTTAFNLYINNISHKDVGLYQCFVFTSKNTAVFTYDVLLAAQHAGYMRKLIFKRNALDQSKNLELTLEEYPTSIKIAWNKLPFTVYNYTIKWGDVYTGPNFTTVDGRRMSYRIQNLKSNTPYYISVSAFTKEVGSLKPILKDARTLIRRKIVTLPIPVKLKRIKVQSKWAKISWTNSGGSNVFDDANKTYYRVKFWLASNQNNKEMYKKTKDTFTYLYDLQPDKKYEFCVQSCLDQNCSDWSLIEGFKTVGTKPSDPPHDLTLSDVSQPKESSSNKYNNKYNFAVQVSWQPPQNPNGKIRNYIILLTAEIEVDSLKWIERTVSGKHLNTVIDRLEYGRFYYFRIYCTNEYGTSPFSPISVFKTPDDDTQVGYSVPLNRIYKDSDDMIELHKFVLSYDKNRRKNSTNNHLNSEVSKSFWSAYKLWITIGFITIMALLALLLVFCCVYRMKRKKIHSNSKTHQKYEKNENIKFLTPQQNMTTPDLFRHTNEKNPHKFMDINERTDSPHSINSGKEMNFNPSYLKKHSYNSDSYVSSGIIPPNVVMTTSQITNNSSDPNFYPVSFLHHIGPNSVNIFSNATPRVNAAASDFNSINFDPSLSDLNRIEGSQGTILYEMSTPKSSGGKSSLSGSGSYNGFSKVPLVNKPINENFDSAFKNEDPPESDVKKAFSSEELSQEMENLEGLMKDLNHITQKEFEC